MEKKGGVGGRGFDEFWAAYPRKVGKGGARVAFIRAASKTSVDAMLDALTRQKAERDLKVKHGVFTPDWKHPQTWLNQECWSDQVLDEPGIVALAAPTGKRKVSDPPPRVVKPWTCDLCGATMLESQRYSHVGPPCPKWKPMNEETRAEIRKTIADLGKKFSTKEALKSTTTTTEETVTT